jgi:hypothetical protein
MTNDTGSDGAVRASNPAVEHAEQPPVLEPERRAAIDWGDVSITVALLLTFVAAFITARQWEAIAALFPQVATGIGAVLSAFFLARALFFPRSSAETPVQQAATFDPLVAAAEAEEQGSDQSESERAFFASLSLRDWAVSLAFFGAFFVSLYVLGLYITSVLFTVAYLKLQAKSSWLFSVIYAVVLTAALYGLFGYALQLPVPEGVFGLSGL